MLDSETAANKFSPPSVDAFVHSGVIGRGNDLNRRQCRRPLHLALAQFVNFVLIQGYLNQFLNLPQLKRKPKMSSAFLLFVLWFSVWF